MSNEFQCSECLQTDVRHMAKGLCSSCYLKKYREANKERIEVTKEAWRQRNWDYVKEKAKRYRDQMHFSGKREHVVVRDSKACVRCGSTERLVVHHKDGRGRGSATPNNEEENLITECRRCHLEEHREKVNNARKLSVLGKWAHHYDCCVECGTTARKHYSHGRCVNCHARFVKKSKRGT